MAISDYQKQQRQAELEAQKDLNDAQQLELEGLQAINRERKRSLEYTNDLTGELAKQLKYTEKQTEAFRGVVNAFSPLNEKAADLFNTITALKDPLTAGFKLIELSAKRFVELDNAGKAFRESTGFLSSQTKEIETNIRQSSRDLGEFGITVEAAKESATALANAFGDTSIASKENLEYVSLMKQNLGVSADDSVSLMQNFMGIGGMTSQVARETAGAAASLAKAAGVPFGAVMKEVAKPSNEVRSLIRGSVDALIKGAIEAKRLGTSLEAVGRAAAGVLDFQNSINDEMEASVLFGKDINLQKMRELSYAGDLKGVAKEQARLLQEAGDVSKMDFFQRQGIAKALGMSVEEMDKMNAKQKELNDLKIKDPALYAKYTANLDTINKTNESLSEKYEKELKSQQLASQQEKIMNSINSIMVELADALLPVINTLVPILGVLFKISVVLIKFILSPFRLLNDAIDYFFKTFSDTKQSFDDFGNKINQFFSDILNPDNLAGKVTLFVAGLAGLIVTAMSGGTIMGLITSAITSPFKLAFKFLPDYFKGAAVKGVSGATEAVPSGAASATGGGDLTKGMEATSKSGENIKPTAGENIKNFLKSLSDGIKSFTPLADILKGLIGIAASGPAFLLFIPAIPGILLMAAVGALAPLITAGFTGLSAGIKMMDITAIGKGLLGIAALGISIIPFAFAMSLFSDVNWTGVMAGAAALVVFTAAAFGLGALLASGVGAVLFAAGVAGIAALGVAMLPFAYAAKLAGEGMKDFGIGVKDIAANISELASLKDTLSVFKDQEVINGIYAMGMAIAFLNSQLEQLGVNLPALGEVNKIKGEQGRNDEVVGKLDELIELMRNGGIGVNLDGTRLNTALGINVKFRGATGTP